MKKRYLVTGGAGFIGSAIVKRLVKEGHFVRVFDNNFRGAISKLGDTFEHIEFIEADIRNYSAVCNAAKGVDSIIHLAYVNGTDFFYNMPDLVLDVGVRGILNVLEACYVNEIKELIFASSSEVYQEAVKIPTDEKVSLIIPDVFNPRYSYAGGKIISELMIIHCAGKKIDRSIIFRPHNVYGPDMGCEHVMPQFILRMKELCCKCKDDEIQFPIQGTGKETRAFVYIDDFVDGLMLLLEKGEEKLADTVDAHGERDVKVVRKGMKRAAVDAEMDAFYSSRKKSQKA